MSMKFPKHHNRRFSHTTSSIEMKFGILGNIVKPNIADVAGILFSCLRNHKLSFVVHDLLAQSLKSSPIGSVITDEMIVNEYELPEKCDMLIALGGDGTMLAAARMVGEHQIPILGVNLGKLGFLAEVSVDEMCVCIDSIVRGDFRIEDRMVLTATTANDGKIFYALNEIVVDRGSSAALSNWKHSSTMNFSLPMLQTESL